MAASGHGIKILNSLSKTQHRSYYLSSCSRRTFPVNTTLYKENETRKSDSESFQCTQALEKTENEKQHFIPSTKCYNSHISLANRKLSGGSSLKSVNIITQRKYSILPIDSGTSNLEVCHKSKSNTFLQHVARGSGCSSLDDGLHSLPSKSSISCEVLTIMGDDNSSERLDSFTTNTMTTNSHSCIESIKMNTAKVYDNGKKSKSELSLKEETKSETTKPIICNAIYSKVKILHQNFGNAILSRLNDRIQHYCTRKYSSMKNYFEENKPREIPSLTSASISSISKDIKDQIIEKIRNNVRSDQLSHNKFGGKTGPDNTLLKSVSYAKQLLLEMRSRQVIPQKEYPKMDSSQPSYNKSLERLKENQSQRKSQTNIGVSNFVRSNVSSHVQMQKPYAFMREESLGKSSSQNNQDYFKGLFHQDVTRRVSATNFSQVSRSQHVPTTPKVEDNLRRNKTISYFDNYKLPELKIGKITKNKTENNKQNLNETSRYKTKSEKNPRMKSLDTVRKAPSTELPIKRESEIKKLHSTKFNKSIFNFFPKQDFKFDPSYFQTLDTYSRKMDKMFRQDNLQTKMIQKKDNRNLRKINHGVRKPTPNDPSFPGYWKSRIEGKIESDKMKLKYGSGSFIMRFSKPDAETTGQRRVAQLSNRLNKEDSVEFTLKKTKEMEDYPQYRYKTSKRNYPDYINRRNMHKTNFSFRHNAQGSYDEKYFLKHDWAERFIEDREKTMSIYMNKNEDESFMASEEERNKNQKKEQRKEIKTLGKKISNSKKVLEYIAQKNTPKMTKPESNRTVLEKTPIADKVFQLAVNERRKAYEAQKTVYHKSYDKNLKNWSSSASSTVNGPAIDHNTLSRNNSKMYMNYLLNRFEKTPMKRKENISRKGSDDLLVAELDAKTMPAFVDPKNKLEHTDSYSKSTASDEKLSMMNHFAKRNVDNSRWYKSYQEAHSKNMPVVVPKFEHNNLLKPSPKKFLPKKMFSFDEERLPLKENNNIPFNYRVKKSSGSYKFHVNDDEEESCNDKYQIKVEADPLHESQNASAEKTQFQEVPVEQNQSDTIRKTASEKKRKSNASFDENDEVLIPVLSSSTAQNLPELPRTHWYDELYNVTIME